IYGVDIDPSAIDIARLRLWLSLIVDEDDYDNIEALPNLDYKIMQGNSLISECMGLNFDEDEPKKNNMTLFSMGADRHVEKLKQRKDFFQKETDKGLKEKLRQEIDDLIIEIFENRLKKQKSDLSQKLKKIEEDDSVFRIKKRRDEIIARKKQKVCATSGIDLKNLESQLREFTSGRKVKPFFLWKLYFAEIFQDAKGGFDLVIGNPPYVQIQKFSGKQEQKDWEKQKYKTFAKTSDIYCLFYEKGGKLLKNRGILTFITSNKWMRANYGKKMRKYFLEDVAIEHLIDFGDSPIFAEATTYTNIMLFSKNGPHIEPQAWDLTRAYSNHVSLTAMLSANSRGEAVFSEDSFIILPREQAKIKKRIEEVGTPLKEWDISINYGIKTGFNEAFIIDGKKKDELIAQDPKNAEIIKPILRGRDIKRYKADFADLWLIATFPALNLDINNYPVTRDYLKSFGKKLNQTGEKYIDSDGNEKKSRKKTGNRWFETQDQIAYHQEFERKK
ncbi:MAG: Eco57I restriction-modification methylase domain-containing protein, partial [Desulfobulbaceae bacterium]|nr:Eco57I restriction-modification methylase domain-containing protein [Desulfobulbaceae bacterium]